MPTEIIEHVDGATIIYTLDDEYRSHVDFRAVEISGTDCFENGQQYERGYRVKGWTSSHEFTYDPHNAEPYVEGSVKWDGCVNFLVGDHDSQVMMHACSREDLERISTTLTVIYEHCGELMQERGADILDGVFRCKP